jgi:adenine-specific DNA-methyltransferase
MIIEGDNLEVLKLLQKGYQGKVKMIYIDPPYNTGNDFIYPDNYAESLQTYLEYTGQVDAQGKKFSTNTDTDGRFHSKWLNMMYPWLYLARNLLKPDGAIAISIDDSEFQSLRSLLDEIIGGENLACVFAWQRKDTPANDAQGMSVSHEYVVLYARNAEEFDRNLLPRTAEQLANYKNPDNDPRGPWTRGSLIRREGDYNYLVERPDGTKVPPPKGSSWRVPPATMERLKAEGSLWWGKDGYGELPFAKKFLSEVQQGVVPTTWWDYEFAGSTRNAKADLKELFADGAPFDTPKPVKLLDRLLGVASDPDATVLDFFAGSGTTAHAVLDLNRRDGGNRQFILVQLPEPTGRPDYATISDITKERVRRVIKKLDDEDAKASQQLSLTDKTAPAPKPQDRGFRVFKLAESSFKPWDAEAPKDAKALTEQLELHIDHIRQGRGDADLLYEILLKTGYPPTTPAETIQLAGKTVYSAASGAFLICLERPLTLDLIRAMAERKPERAVCLDEGFVGNDQLKANAVQIFRSKSVVSFKTV